MAGDRAETVSLQDRESVLVIFLFRIRQNNLFLIERYNSFFGVVLSEAPIFDLQELGRDTEMESHPASLAGDSGLQTGRTFCLFQAERA